jgi:hypothetical protein
MFMLNSVRDNDALYVPRIYHQLRNRQGGAPEHPLPSPVHGPICYKSVCYRIVCYVMVWYAGKCDSTPKCVVLFIGKTTLTPTALTFGRDCMAVVVVVVMVTTFWSVFAPRLSDVFLLFCIPSP